ncbi:hypothetical protein ILUMI_04602 [Ignelater luminosus]|uniref:Heat shock protein 70 n=1 Tax=Ignelater luminosus TaxID=2038154 RepID=A0A8K0GIW3_IGNLU|nr:hypothetical protein ILUMI_04602 [Ignelater luminosus]
MSDDSPAIGIDLGTTYCCAAYMNYNKNVEIIKNQLGYRTTPSYVFFSGDTTLIGKRAKEEVYLTGENVVYDSKRLIGQRFTNPNVQKNLDSWPFRVLRGKSNKPLIKVTTNTGSVNYKPEDVSAKLLTYIKQTAEERLDRPVKNAVITVPAYFNYHQRTATERAGNLAGLNILRIINEPTAAALAYVHSNEVQGTKNFLVFDLGGGTFDVSIITADGNKSIVVKATSGNTYLGGRDFDENLANYIISELEDKYKVSLKDEEFTIRRIRARSEKIKIDLTESNEVQYDILGLVPQTTDAYHNIKREDFEKINEKLFEECINIVHDCLKDACMVASDIDKVILTGGSSRVPKLQEMLKHLFGNEKISKGVDPDEAVAYGAAVQAAMLSRKDTMAVVPKITDVTPLSLGTRVYGEKMNIVIKRNSQIPVTKTVTLYTVYDNQEGVHCDIYEGERPLVEHNTKIGSCSLSIPAQPPGYPLKLTFHVNENGVLKVRAKTEDGVYTSLVIQYESQSILTITDILREAKLNKHKDDAVRDVVSMWVNLQEYCIRIETTCKYDKNKLSSEEKETVLKAAVDVSKWLDTNVVKNGDPTEIEAILEKRKSIEEVCEPILAKYNYKIKDMGRFEFYNFAKQLKLAN